MWRPFQLGYQLLALESLINEDHPDRESVDLLWVPTGGGKTEAYLMLTAFEIFRRRLIYGDSGSGTTVITRYTLRLLTTQQFQRASALICACESIRRNQTDTLGMNPITIGLWVGQSTSPNTYQEANRVYLDLLSQQIPSNPFQIMECPWCSASMVPERQSEPQHYGFTATNDSFSMHCPDDSCEFHDRLPIGVVDADLYDHPPTMLIATVDKFARLAWEERGGVFFGDEDHLPPSLIIQDELHLITGPLGTAVGLYETAITALLKLRNATPKVLASTATIRRPDLQISGIFGKQVRVFPPSGLSGDDSYFTKADPATSRNRYVGIMSSSHTSVTTLVRTAASLLQGWYEEGIVKSRIAKEDLDAFSTLVMYHNSLRELGGSSKYIRDDIPAWINEIALAQDQRRTFADSDVLELTGTLNSNELPESLGRMSIPYHQHGAVTAMLCTNMFSVGVDEPRLGLMLVQGQPKTTAEYIQSTGRVGRGSISGLVVTHYSGQKSRDRSHYESFKKYHSSLYSYVEPGSVTPFSRPARERALHAVIVILVRHWLGLSKQDDAHLFRKDMPGLDKVVSTVLEIAYNIDPDELVPVREHIHSLIQQWEEAALEAEANGKGPLVYSSLVAGNVLLKNFGTKARGIWPTLNSMRNVDRECLLWVNGNA
jgi:hypothetical protein